MKHVAIAALLFSSTPSLAAENNTMTVGQLLDACTRPSMHWVDFCNGFFQATHDSAAVEKQVCLPEGTTRTELVELFELEANQLVIAHPNFAQRNGITIARAILRNAFPCRQ